MTAPLAWVLAAVVSAVSGARAVPQDDDPLLQCWLDSSVLLESSPSLEGHLPRIAAEGADVAYQTTTLADGTEARVAGLRIHLDARGGRGGEEHVLEVLAARPTSDLDGTLAQLRLLLVLTWLTSSIGCAAILSWVVRRGLNPLGLLRRELRGLDEGSLDQRVQLPDAPEELAPVVHQLNELLGRLQGAFAREHAFTAHAAHELRTPLAGLRTTLELALARPRTVEGYRESAQSCLQIALEMQGMVEDLLELARLADPGPRPRVPVRVDQLLQECREPYLARAEERRLRWKVDLEPGVLVSVEPQLLRRVLHNLMDNAVSYADPATTIEVVAHAGTSLELRVSNRTTGAPHDVAQHAFDPLWRADASRTATGRHAGLGLSLCKRILELLGGTIEARYEDEVFTVTLQVPTVASK